ncbi:hypothetical protein GCM10018952_38250 [Streptosporangium vulgare]
MIPRRRRSSAATGIPLNPSATMNGMPTTTSVSTAPTARQTRTTTSVTAPTRTLVSRYATERHGHHVASRFHRVSACQAARDRINRQYGPCGHASTWPGLLRRYGQAYPED